MNYDKILEVYTTNAAILFSRFTSLHEHHRVILLSNYHMSHCILRDQLFQTLSCIQTPSANDCTKRFLSHLTITDKAVTVSATAQNSYRSITSCLQSKATAAIVLQKK
jgi:hypothetical protein